MENNRPDEIDEILSEAFKKHFKDETLDKAVNELLEESIDELPQRFFRKPLRIAAVIVLAVTLVSGLLFVNDEIRASTWDRFFQWLNERVIFIELQGDPQAAMYAVWQPTYVPDGLHLNLYYISEDEYMPGFTFWYSENEDYFSMTGGFVFFGGTWIYICEYVATRETGIGIEEENMRYFTVENNGILYHITTPLNEKAYLQTTTVFWEKYGFEFQIQGMFVDVYSLINIALSAERIR
ncbi:MAG: DUF4367 domain-containing protein [Defluviitaleaceae bacterium]|nr:DUF4367 domain-containing protein [Defluviitaleaceae bacterium]MCL2262963.1 DUF4367 domain-containing protein [Defluviitaleaceae bacterium]